MEFRQLGQNGPHVSTIGLGAWPIGGGMGAVAEKEAIATIRTALDAGINLLDTAQFYRSSESVIGKALADGYRERCFLATKVSGNYSKAAIVDAIENSLRAMHTETIDLYQVHWWDDKYPIDETMDAMLRLQESGKVRYIGVSNYNDTQMQKALEYGRYHANQFCYNLLQRQSEPTDIPFCEREGIGILVHSALAKGLLTGKYQPGHTFASDDERSQMPQFQGEAFAQYLSLAEKLRTIARNKGTDLIQLAVAWPLRLPSVTSVLVGAKSPNQVKAHVKAAGVTFTTEELTAIEHVLSEIPQLPNPQRDE